MKAAIQSLAKPLQSSFTYRVKSSSQFPLNWHFHPEYALTYIERSQGQRFVGDNISRYTNGDLVLLGPNLPHSWQSAQFPEKLTRHRAYVIQFGEHFPGSEGLAYVELRQVGKLLERSANGLCFSGSVRDVAAKRIKALNRTSGVRGLTGMMELLDILARSRKGVEISSSRFVPSLHLCEHRRIDRVMQYNNEHFRESTSQAEVAAHAEMSPTAFSSFFKMTVGMTYVKYVNSLRISYACQRLIDTDLSGLDISQRSGFSNLSNFDRRVLEAKETSPRRYRAQFQLDGN